MKFMACLNKDTKKTKGHFLYIRGGAVKIATGVIGVGVSQGKMFSAHASLGMSGSPHTYH